MISVLAERVQREIDDLAHAYPGMQAGAAPDGSIEIVIPRYPLPAGWSAPTCEVLVVAPPLYPDQQPDNFWSTPGITTPSDRPPNNIMGLVGKQGRTWNQYSWHWGATRWDRDCYNLAIFIRSIARFFQSQS